MIIEFDDRTPEGLSHDEILREYIKLDRAVKELATTRSWYASYLAQTAAQERGNLKTVHLETADGKQRVKTEFKTEWVVKDPDQIDTVRKLLGDVRFFEIFRVEYKARSRPLQSILATASGDERFRTGKAILKEIMVEEDLKPTVSVEKS